MSQDDPFAVFGDDDKTIMRPTPGGRRRIEPAPPEPRPHSMLEPGPSLSRTGYDDNPLTAPAASLFSLAARLRGTGTPPNVAELQHRLVSELREFENGALQRGVSQQQVATASYALCSLLDETILNTPWGAQSTWGHQSLLVMFHKEAWGGEKFFEFLKRLVQQPAQNLNLLQFFFLCLALGFEGKYRIAEGGAQTLDRMRAELIQLIERVRGGYDRDLSPRWHGLKDLRPALVRFVPFWVVAAGALALLALVYLGFLMAANSASDPVFQKISALPNEEFRAETGPLSMPPAKAGRFRTLLATEINRGLVDVVNDRVLRIHNSFESGSDRVKPEFRAMLQKIGAELAAGGDQALVSGHTDDRPIRSVRFPSNFDLSYARAKHVAEILLVSASLSGQVRFEGRADTQPLVPNDTPEHRAINRRVDILVR